MVLSLTANATWNPSFWPNVNSSFSYSCYSNVKIDVSSKLIMLMNLYAAYVKEKP